MRIVREDTLISCGKYASSREWKRTRKSLYRAIREVEWPPGSGSFTIYPESGKKRGQGNGVVPIKNGLMEELVRQGWTREVRLAVKGIGKLDAVLETAYGVVALEWETGNISSSHRALNKMSLGLMKGVLVCGILVVPSRNLYRYLTDRIGSMEELDPYLDLWRSIRCKHGVLEIVAIEHDATSTDVPRIPKMTAGRALG
jgi:hypothetical protein